MIKTFCICLVVYPDGRVCISILHAPGDDPMGYESSAERWSPVQSVEKILLSVVSMLAGEESVCLLICALRFLFHFSKQHCSFKKLFTLLLRMILFYFSLS